MTAERQSIQRGDRRLQPSRRTRRNYKRLPAPERQTTLDRWFTQTMYMPFLRYVEVWRACQGTRIAYSAGHNVLDGSSEMDEFITEVEVIKAINKAKRLNLPANDLVRKLAIVTKEMAYKTHDVGGWTASYFGHVVDLIVVQTYSQTQNYAEELKRKELPNAFAA